MPCEYCHRSGDYHSHGCPNKLDDSEIVECSVCGSRFPEDECDEEDGQLYCLICDGIMHPIAYESKEDYFDDIEDY